MKQGKIFMRVILILLLLATVGLLAYSAFHDLTSPLHTTIVYEYEVGHGCTTEGYFVRDELPVGSAWPINVLAREDGEKVGAAQLVARGYQSNSAKEDQEESEALAQRLEQLRYAYSDPLSVSETEQLQATLSATLVQLARSLNGNGTESAASVGSRVKGQTLRLYAGDSDRALLAEQIQSAEARLAELRGSVSTGSNAVSAAEAGWFSSQVDGYEGVLTPDILDTLTIAKLKELEPEETSPNLIGRLSRNEIWYFVCPVPEQYAAELAVGDMVDVTFSSVTGGPASMRLERIGLPEDGERLLVLYCRRNLTDTISLRYQGAQLTFQSYTGLRVPKDAISYQDGSAGVYVVESSYAKWKPVTILYDAGESYVIRQDKSSTGNLWAGDEVIVGDRDLFDGKVVK